MNNMCDVFDKSTSTYRTLGSVPGSIQMKVECTGNVHLAMARDIERSWMAHIFLTKEYMMKAKGDGHGSKSRSTKFC